MRNISPWTNPNTGEVAIKLRIICMFDDYETRALLSFALIGDDDNVIKQEEFPVTDLLYQNWDKSASNTFSLVAQSIGVTLI